MAETTTRELRVLVVDDNLDTALGLSLLMRAMGHQPRMTHDGIANLTWCFWTLDCRDWTAAK
jgi:hypothetical protein